MPTIPAAEFWADKPNPADDDGISWDTAPEIAKRGLPLPPEPDKYSSDDAYDQAKNSWVRQVMPILSLRVTALRNS